MCMGFHLYLRQAIRNRRAGKWNLECRNCINQKFDNKRTHLPCCCPCICCICAICCCSIEAFSSCTSRVRIRNQHSDTLPHLQIRTPPRNRHGHRTLPHRKPHADSRRVLQKLLRAFAHALLFVGVQCFPAEVVHALAKAPLHQSVVHTQAVPRLHRFHHLHHLSLVLLAHGVQIRRRESRRRAHRVRCTDVMDVRCRGLRFVD
mmetsp:Transcript_4836/g.30747  ORF Transcript_4836/g.30747 Transcript_4836/m.30747 type:complete len:204 (-) Transcript_4836:1700-2311(-)